VIFFHHIAGAQLLAAPAHSAPASRRVATHLSAQRRSTAHGFAPPHCASRLKALHRNTTQFQKEPYQPQHTPFKFPWRDQTQPWVTVPPLRASRLRTATLRFAARRLAPFRSATRRISTQ